MPKDIPRTVKIATVWLLLGAAVFLGFRVHEARQQRLGFSFEAGVVELRRGADGHYHWPGTLNGRPLEFLVDTGASRSAVSAALARELGLEEFGGIQAQTAAGPVRARLARADLALEGGVQVQRLPLMVLPGLGDVALLGMDVLGRLRLQQTGTVLRIEPAAEP